MTGIEEAIVAGLVGTGLLSLGGCDDSEEENGLIPDGISSESEPEADMGVPRDVESPRDASPPDTFHRRDAFVSPDEGVPPVLRPDVNIFSGSRLAIFASQFGAAEGILYSLNLDPIGKPVEEARIPSTDVILRYLEDNLYAIDRTHGVIYMYDTDLNPVREIDVGNGTNPQDIVVLPGEEKAYVTRLDAQNDPENDDDLWSINPYTGDFLGGADFTQYTTDYGDQLARAAQMVLVGANLYVAVQDLSSFFAADTNGKVIVINTATDEVSDAIQLDGRNPADITYSEILDKVFVTNTGRYEPDYTIDLSTAFGGIEVVGEGMLIDDLDLEGAVSEIRLASGELGYVMTGFTKIASFNPETGAVLSTDTYLSPSFFLPDFSIYNSEELVIAEQGDSSPGSDGIIIPPADPIGLELPPASLAFMP